MSSKLRSKIIYRTYLRDVLFMAVTAFGGPQAHIAMMLKLFVAKKKYLTEEELIELNALCQILPGPTSTQTITAIGFKLGGARLAYLTLFIWILPAVLIMTTLGILVNIYQAQNIDLAFTKFIQPMAVGFIAYGAYVLASKVVNNTITVVLMIISAVLSYFITAPFVLPIVLLFAGVVTALRYKDHAKEESKVKVKIKWGNFTLWAAVLAAAGLLGAFTQDRFVLLFENFYRNGSLIFGGGQVLIPFLNSEFVVTKGLLTSQEFLSGLGMVQALPGPVFSFSAYIGALSVDDLGIGGQIFGGLISAIGVFLPGTFLIFFVIRFWEELKKYRVVRASLAGISAASAGMVAAAAFILFEPIEFSLLNICVVLGTFILLTTTKLPAPFIILGGLLAGFIL